MADSRFKIVFEKLAEVAASGEEEPSLSDQVEELREELDEIRELRRLSVDLASPPKKTYTAT